MNPYLDDSGAPESDAEHNEDVLGGLAVGAVFLLTIMAYACAGLVILGLVVFALSRAIL
jgi:hypothetical protein